MRRILLVLALATAPALAAAQAEGVVQGRTNNLINRQMCQGTAGLELLWTTKLISGSFAAAGQYRVYASNQKRTPAAGDTDQRTCFRPGDTGQTGLLTVEVTTFDAVNLSERRTVAAADMAKLAAGVGADCASTANTPVYLCVLWHDAGGTYRGYANGDFTLTAAAPPTPTNVRVRPGENALNVSWTEDDSTSVDAVEYRVEAITDDPRDSRPGEAHTTTVASATARVSGLVNGVAYRVVVIAISDAENESAPSAEVIGIPAFTEDFWEWYDGRGGVEQGGCATGAAGLLALVGAAALLRLRRRKP